MAPKLHFSLKNRHIGRHLPYCRSILKSQDLANLVFPLTCSLSQKRSWIAVMFSIHLRSSDFVRASLLGRCKYSVLGYLVTGGTAPYAEEICENDTCFVLLDVIAI